MFKKIIKYEDLDGNPREKTCYFHFSEVELAEMETSKEGGLLTYATKITEENDQKKLIELFKELVLNAYGERDPSGEYFIKNDELRQRFTQSEAYSTLFMELASDDKKAAEFFNKLIPKKLAEKMKEKENKSLEQFSNLQVVQQSTPTE